MNDCAMIDVLQQLLKTPRFDLDDTLYPVSTGFSDHRNGEADNDGMKGVTSKLTTTQLNSALRNRDRTVSL